MLFENVTVGRYATIRRAIIDKNVVVPAGAQIGVSEEDDLARGFVVDEGLTVLAKGQAVPS